MAENQFEPGVYVRGDQTRLARTPGAAVAAVWDGFRPATQQQTEDADYRDLQAQAKRLGIPANQSKDALAAAIASHVVVEPDEDTDPDQP